MGFFKKLLGVGVVAGTTAAAIKVAEKVKENNPDGFADENGKVEPQAVVGEVVRAAADFYHETADIVKDKAPEVVDKVKGFAAGLGMADAPAADAAPAAPAEEAQA